jgi:uncharacterized membrane protein
MPPQTSKPEPHPNRLTDETGLERLIFFSDAVFAIAITLLILDIRLPEAPVGTTGPNSRELFTQLTSLGPQYLAYIISFLVIGLFWMNHHRKFRSIYAYNRRMMMLNLILLMAVAFLPFPTSIISAYANSTGVIFYALSVSLAGFLATLLWWYVSRNRLIDPHLTQSQIRRETLRGLVVPAIFLLSIPIALVNPDLAMFSWILIAPLLVWMG